MINDRYKIINKIGEGRSKVFLCEDILRLGKRLAVKILPVFADADEKNSFRDESNLFRIPKHPSDVSSLAMVKPVTVSIGLETTGNAR